MTKHYHLRSKLDIKDFHMRLGTVTVESLKIFSAETSCFQHRYWLLEILIVILVNVYIISRLASSWSYLERKFSVTDKISSLAVVSFG